MALHDMLANHRDLHHKAGDTQDAQIGKAGFNCSCESLVVESPFVEGTGNPSLFLPVSWSVLPEAVLKDFYSGTILFNELRGPPSSFLI